MPSDAIWEATPNDRATVDCGWSRSGSSAAPAHTPAHASVSASDVGPPQSVGMIAAAANPTAAPDIACVGPITMQNHLRTGLRHRPRVFVRRRCFRRP